jgi:uncharacterized protein
MIFWDSSAILPLCLKEGMSPAMKKIALSDPDMVVWWGTRVECISALARRLRECTVGQDGERQFRSILNALSSQWSEVQPGGIVRQRAERLLMTHFLRVADAFQLAAALVWAGEIPSGLEVACLDVNLGKAFQKEGFTVVP